MATKSEVLSFLQTIPHGKVTTYKALAEKFDTHPRGIGSMLRTNNKTVEFPCYKVVAHDGGLSGYILWVHRKIELLESEGIVICDGKVDEVYIIRYFL